MTVALYPTEEARSTRAPSGKCSWAGFPAPPQLELNSPVEIAEDHFTKFRRTRGMITERWRLRYCVCICVWVVRKLSQYTRPERIAADITGVEIPEILGRTGQACAGEGCTAYCKVGIHCSTALQIRLYACWVRPQGLRGETLVTRP